MFQDDYCSEFSITPDLKSDRFLLPRFETVTSISMSTLELIISNVISTLFCIKTFCKPNCIMQIVSTNFEVYFPLEKK